MADQFELQPWRKLYQEVFRNTVRSARDTICEGPLADLWPIHKSIGPANANHQAPSFLQRSLAASSAATWALSFEEQALLANADQTSTQLAPVQPAGRMPAGQIGQLTMSRLICGGNLIAGFAHSRDLIYVSKLMTTYFTDAKIFETLALCEANGINTAK